MSPNADLVLDKPFENGIVKALNGDELEPAEESALRRFKAEDAAVMEVQHETNSFAENILAAKKPRIGAGKNYRVEWIPVTSNVVERLFSRAKLTVGSLRTSLTPLHLEAILFLFVNNKYWDASLIQTLI